MSRIATFYSYKGGVGRSMALANIAVLLAQRGLRVMAVDWDLEAPGLERYFDYYEKSVARGGLLSFLTEQHARLAVKDAHPERYADQLWSIDVGGAHPLKLLGSGRSNHLDYARTLDQFSWTAFFERGGGDFLEQLRELWKAEFDVVLIDSRTGMSDSGGICTIQMPDVLVAMFTANYQSVLGVRDVVASVREARQRLAYDRLALTVLPLACRIPSSADPSMQATWFAQFASDLGDCFDSWIPKDVQAADALRWLTIPHAPGYALGERLVAEEVSDGDDDVALRIAYGRIARLLASEFEDIGELGARGPGDSRPGPDIVNSKGYEFDIYISFARTGTVLSNWIGRFVSLVGERFEQMLGRRIRVFFDLAENRSDDGWRWHVDRSAVLLAFLTPEYFANSTCLRELQEFEDRRDVHGVAPIVPVQMRGVAEMPEQLRALKPIDASKVGLSADDDVGLIELVTGASIGVAVALRSARPYEEVMWQRSQAIAVNARGRDRLLVLPANPTLASDTDLAVVGKDIERALRERPGALNVVTAMTRTLEDLDRAVREHAPKVLHFVGSGSSDGIYLTGSDGLPEAVSGDDLAVIFREAKNLRVIVLDACYNDAQVRAFAPSVRDVIAVKPGASQRAARTFLDRFYRDFAVDDGASRAFADGQQFVMAFEPEGSESPFVMFASGRGFA